MTYLPAIPLSGYAGWRVLQRTDENQRAAFANSAEIQRDIAYFKENIGIARTPEALIADHRLLKVALGAFGLDDKISQKAFIRKVLTEGSEDPAAFANKLTDPKFAELAQSFGYGNLAGANVGLSDFSTSVVTAYVARQYEQAVGQTDDTMRLALNFQREIGEYTSGASDTALWLRIMGNQPLRRVVEQGLGLPAALGALDDLDQQVGAFRDAAARVFGSDSAAAFSNPDNVDKILRNYFARAQAADGPGPLTRGYGALTLMQNAASAWQNFYNQ